MVGISGVIYPDVFQIDGLIPPMLKTLSHRGGIGPHEHTFKNMQLGICGGEFETNARGTIVLTIDGMIDNAAALRKEIAPPKSEKNTHIVILAYGKWGPDCLEHLEGDFALALIDQQEKHLLLARDRIGKKPLYWYHGQKTFLFASELKALLATGVVSQTPAPEALASYLYLGYIPQDMTPIQGINKLLPGHYMLIHLDQSKKILPYWSYSSYFEQEPLQSLEEIPAQLDQLLFDAVKIQTPKEGRLGCLIGEGLGSASIASYLSKQHDPASISSFSVGFADETEEEDRSAEVVAKTLKLQHYSEIITPKSSYDEFAKVVWYLDEPVSKGIYRSWEIAKLAQQHVDTLFSGTGSDELLAGHIRYSAEEQHLGLWKALVQTPRAWTAHLLLPILNKIYKSGAYEMLKQSRTNPWQFGYLRDNALFSESELAEAAPRLAKFFDPEVFLHKFHHLHRIKSTVASFLYFDVKTRLPDLFIPRHERFTTVHGLNWRAPYLNRHVVEYLARLPEPEKLTEAETAKFLRMIMRKTFPKEIVDLPTRTLKRVLPIWLLDSELGKLLPLLLQGSLVETGWISKKWLEAKLTEDPGKAIFQLLAIFTLEIWFRLFINRPIESHPPEISVRDLLMEK